MTIFVPFIMIFLVTAGTGSFDSFSTLYFINEGYSLTFIGLMVTAFNLTVSVFEIPFAIVLDRFSSKISILLGFLLRILAFGLFASLISPNWMLVAQILAGTATAATSGTLIALVINEVGQRTYESVKDARSRFTIVSSAGTLTGGTLGLIGSTCFLHQYGC